MSLFNWSPSSVPAFQYTPLDTSQRFIRLLRLLPPRPSRIPGAHGTLRIEIIEANVDSEVSYDALSYSWDLPPNPGSPERQILIETENGTRGLNVYHPLELALLHLAVGNGTPRCLFVDQISINQSDAVEKSHQVQLMRDIYTRCSRTIVWLGPSTRASERYFNYVNTICELGILSRIMGPRVGRFNHVWDAVMDPSFEVNQEEREDRDDILGMIRQFGHGFPLDGLADVLDRRWFNRLWTIPEACLAPVVVFVCGHQSLCFDCFRSGVLFYNIYNTHWVRQRTKPTSHRELRRRKALLDKPAGLSRVVQERRTIHQHGRRQGLYDLVVKYNINDDQRKIGATLAEDRVFGLLGLAADDDSLRQQVRVRYTDEAIQIYTEVAALLLEESVDTLLFSQFPKITGTLPSDTQKLPSWVPDWAMNLAVPVGYSNLKEPVFASGGPREGARFHFDETSRRLTIRGVLVDRIVRVGSRTYQAGPPPQVVTQVDYRWASLVFDEALEFAREAAVAQGGSPASPEEETQTQLSLRLCDSGLSYRHFSTKLGVCAGLKRLGALHGSIHHLGKRLLASDEWIASYHITRIYRTVGITPWYWMPVSEMDSLRICALEPVAAGRIGFEALVDFVTDMIGLCMASAKVSWASWYVNYGRPFRKMSFRPRQEDMARIGIDPSVSFGPDMEQFTSNLLKNTGRRLYRTETGYVGMGPAQMMPGDSVVVFHGGTVPHVLRGSDDAGPWEYLGEVYCDGIMDGEALEAGVGLERSFVLA